MTRSPDFIIVGAMKAGTTTIFRWLGNHPDCALPSVKEPAFFALEDRWMRGTQWYNSLFPEEARVTGEASVSYTDPDRSGLAAQRISSTLPDVRLVFIARHPMERARSHYVHQVQRGRERRSFEAVMRVPDNPYLRRSHYFSTLEPYIGLFAPAQLFIAWFEELFAEDDTEWLRLLDYLGLGASGRPALTYNRSADRPILSSSGQWLADKGLHAVPSWVPTPVRSLARSLLIKESSPGMERLLSSATGEAAPSAAASMWEDAHRFLEWAGSEQNRWQ